MDIDALRRFCLGFPNTTENVQWGYDLCFKVDGKLFTVAPLEVAPAALSFKCTPESFMELCERPGIRPAAYMARAQWVSLERLNTLPDAELRELIAQSYRLVWEKLPKRRRAELEAGADTAKAMAKAKVSTGKPTVAPRPKAGKATKSRTATKAKSAKAGRRT